NLLDLSVIKKTTWEKAVLKPAISGGSYRTTLFDRENWPQIEADYLEFAQENDLLLQCFLPEILSAGEISLIYFNRKFSHAVVKTPKEGDFRIQSQFGGHYAIYNPDAELLQTAGKIIACFEGELLYARIDGVLHDNQFLLMEVEQIEPDLYFYLHESAKNTFVEAILELL
ncbi:MAG: Cycloserine biosynthesis protein DcsG, partial [Bacteroidota bacterium]